MRQGIKKLFESFNKIISSCIRTIHGLNKFLGRRLKGLNDSEMDIFITKTIHDFVTQIPGTFPVDTTHIKNTIMHMWNNPSHLNIFNKQEVTNYLSNLPISDYNTRFIKSIIKQMKHNSSYLNIFKRGRMRNNSLNLLDVEIIETNITRTAHININRTAQNITTESEEIDKKIQDNKNKISSLNTQDLNSIKELFGIDDDIDNKKCKTLLSKIFSSKDLYKHGHIFFNAQGKKNINCLITEFMTTLYLNSHSDNTYKGINGKDINMPLVDRDEYRLFYNEIKKDLLNKNTTFNFNMEFYQYIYNIAINDFKNYYSQIVSDDKSLNEQHLNTKFKKQHIAEHIDKYILEKNNLKSDSKSLNNSKRFVSTSPSFKDGYSIGLTSRSRTPTPTRSLSF